MQYNRSRRLTRGWSARPLRNTGLEHFRPL